MDYQKDVAEEVLAELARRRMSRGKLAERIGISVDALHARLNGRQVFKLNEIAAIAEVFGMTTVELLARAEQNSAVA